MIETPRLLLRQHSLEDFPAYRAMNMDPRVIEYIMAGKPATEEESWNRLMRNAGFWPILGYGLFAVVEKQTQCYVGLTGLAKFCRGLGEDFDPYPEAAWSNVGAAHGKGYGTEAAIAVHDWFRANHGPTRTVCIIDAENAPSLRVAEKIGYRAYDEAIYKDKRVIKFERQA
jgi:RimJ/RimL family protein N-acetyltransferase